MRWPTTFILITVTAIAGAQVPAKLNAYYTTRDGLSNNTTYCIEEDSRNFLWIGTKEGLNRFDGSRFIKYFADRKNNGLPHNNIWDILEYQPGHLLIATASGLAVLNTLTGKFENEKIDAPQLKAGSGTVIYSLYKDKLSNIWVNNNGELDVLDSNLNYRYRFTDVDWAKPLKGVNVFFEEWYMDNRNRLWLPGDTSGINIIDFAEKKIFNYKNNPQGLNYLRNFYIRAFIPDEKNNTIWYAPWGGGLLAYNVATGTEKKVDFGIKAYGEPATVNSIIRLNDSTLLCTIEASVFQLNTRTFQYIQVTTIPNSPSITPGVIMSAFAGTDGHYWLCTLNGLREMRLEKTQYKEFFLPGNFNRQSVLCTDMTISRRGILYCSFTNNVIMVMNKERKLTDAFVVALPFNNTINRICVDQDDQLWIAGSSLGLYLFDSSRNVAYRPSFVPSELDSLFVNSIYCDEDGDVWVNTRGHFGLYRYRRATKKFEKINNAITKHFEGLGINSRVSRFGEDREGRLWMVSRLGGGIICYNKKTSEWKLYPGDKSRLNALFEKGLTSVYPDNCNNLWLSNYFGDGLIKYNFANDSVTYYTRGNGLLSDNIINLCRDSSGNMWLATEYGITQFNTATDTVKLNVPINTDTTSLFGEQIVFDSITNSIVMGLNGRLIFIPVNKIQKNARQVVPVIDRISINNQQRLLSPGQQNFEFNYKENYLSVDFTAIQFNNADKTRFAYQLSDVDKDWKYADAVRTVQYASLAPGHYTFTLKVTDENGEWSSQVSTFSFTINPPFWQTWWFRIGALALVSAIVTFFVRRRISVIRHEAEMKQKIAETEMMALRAQMNPHFIFNCLNAIDNLVQTNQKEKATTYLARFAKLIRSVLDSSKNNVVPFQNDYESLQLYLQMEQFRCNNKFSYELNADEELLHSDYKLPPLIVQPFVENAIHHGLLNKQVGERKLSVSASLENDTIKYTIIDNGVGRAKAQEIKKRNRPEHQSYGITITRERVHLYNQNGKTQDISITDLTEDGNPAGTKVEIRLKIHENNNPVYA